MMKFLETIFKPSKGYSLRSLFSGILCLAVVNLHGASNPNELPDMGSSSSRVLPLNLEQELGDNYMRMLRRELPISDDPLIRSYINQLGFRLVAANPDAENRKFYFFVMEDTVVNAFAMPGGYIGMNSGLILRAESENEVAGVMAHEIAHVTQRHIARRIEQQQQLSLPSMLAMLGSILIMTQDPEAGMAAMTGIQAGATQIMINHTRSNESEADRIGISTLAAANFNPQGMTNFFEKMLMMSRYSGQRLAFLSTHPLSQTRITESRERARNINYVEQTDEYTFQLVQQRLVGTMDQDFSALANDYKSRLANYPENRAPVPLRYGYALIQYRLGNYNDAETLMQSLIQNDRSNPFYIIALAEILTAQGKAEKAIRLLQEPVKLNPGNDAYTLAYAKALVAQGDTQAALDVLYEHLPKLDTEPFIYELIADVQSKHGLFKEVHESTGLFLYHSGDLQGALNQFKLAMSGHSDDPYFNARISARIRKVQQEILLLR